MVQDWLYDDDHALGVDVALRKGKSGVTYNIAGDNECENIVLINRLLARIG